MSLRTRLTLAGSGAVFVALAIASLVIYVEVRSKLRDQIDFSLVQSAENVAVKWHSNAALAFSKDQSGFFQVIPSLARRDECRTFGDRSAAHDERRDDRAELDDARPQGRGGADPRRGQSGGGRGVAPVLQERSLRRRGDAAVHDATAVLEATGWCGPCAR